VCAAQTVAPPPVPVVIHFARFEEPFLRALHERHGAGPFPFDLVCTHALARRLLPELPRRTLRALAGYFGAGVPPLRRSADHVVATAVVWHHLIALLAEREGVVDLGELQEWLTRPARRSPRCFPLPRQRRRELPDRPGVYRLLRRGGAVLYVGKAASLRQRVSGHFHARPGERALEMLTQVRDVSCTETDTALEAALLEADEIKRLAPPFNVALAAAGRAVWFATADLGDLRERPDAEHAVGPLVSPASVEALSALRAALAAGDSTPASLIVRSRAVGVEPAYAPGPACFAAGLARFAGEHGSLADTRAFLRLGARLWARRRATPASEPEPGDTIVEGPPTPRQPAWDSERVVAALEETVLRAAHAVRRARWLLRLSESSLAWAEPGAEKLRVLVIRGGAVITHADFEPGTPGPVPPGYACAPAERLAVFDVAAFDRLRVLTTELRGLAAGDATVELRLGPHARLSRHRLRAVLRWV
jgi:DNA polymerase-3 subunit epsilon